MLLVTAANGMRFQENMRNVHGAAKGLCHDKCSQYALLPVLVNLPGATVGAKLEAVEQ